MTYRFKVTRSTLGGQFLFVQCLCRSREHQDQQEHQFEKDTVVMSKTYLHVYMYNMSKKLSIKF